MHNLEANLQRVRVDLAAAAARAGRDPDSVQLVAVTKTLPPERVEQALAAGLTVFGESRLQEARAKIPVISSRARWHLIGHLQSNKARDAVSLFELIHSVDSVRLAVELNKWADRLGKTQAVLIEINVSGEASKFGMKPEDLESALRQLQALPRLEVHGLMTIAPFAEDPEKARPSFRRLRELRDAAAQQGWALPQLSMGMSHDFTVAIEEGATLIRVGTALFGERSKTDEGLASRDEPSPAD